MKLDLPLDEMSIEEKLLLMENIWKDLKKSEQDFPSPEWHEEELNQCEKSITEGESTFINWEEAKKNIRNAVE
jgi:hypothetical protein